MPESRDVVITGMGVVCPLGVGTDAYWAALEGGVSGIELLFDPPHPGLPYRYVSRIKNYDAKEYVQPRKTLKVMCEAIQAAYGAAAMAAAQGKIEKGTVEADRFGVVLGSEVLYGELDELKGVFSREEGNDESEIAHWSGKVFRELFPLWMLKYLPNMAACHISIAHDARGPNNSIVAGPTSSLSAVIEAAEIIRRGHADVMLAGGSGAISSLSCIPFRGYKQLSKWEGEPAGASRPFDARRSGFVPGEGAGLLLLEARESAERRGAPILARLAGMASCFEPRVGAAPLQGTAIKQSIERSLATAKMKPSDIGHVNAHGESSPVQDRLEAEAIRQTLGDVPVTAPKSFFGDLGGGAGAVEMIASVLALQHGRVPYTLNYEEPDPACPVNVVHGQPLAVSKSTALVLNQAPTGQAVAVVIARE